MIGPGLVPHWLSCSKVLHYYHHLLCRENTAWVMQWRHREKQNDQDCHEKASSFHLAKFWMIFYCFIFEKMSSSIPILLAMLFTHVGKISNSRWQMFSKTGVLKNFAIFTVQKLFLKPLFDKVSVLKTCIFI